MLLDQHFVDAGAIHVDNLEVEALPAERVARLGHALKQLEDQAAEGVVVVVGIEILHVKILEEVIEGVLSVDEPTAIGALLDL